MGSPFVRSLQGRVRGRVLGPDDEAYESARKVWNGAIDRRPAAILRCADRDDVAAGLDLARSEGLPLAIRGGGHNVAGSAVVDGGLVIDFSAMKGITIDPDRRIARIQPGVLWGELDATTQRFGLALPGGIVTHTGVAGLTLGGGIGWLMRRYGLTCDSLVAADVITPEGRLIRAEDREAEGQHAELLWALRGGGGNFGVVVGFEFALHPVGPMVLAGPLVYSAAQAGEVLRFYRDFVAEAPDELTTIVSLRLAPAAPWMPTHLHRAPVLIISACYAGSPEEGEQVLQPLRRFGPPLVDALSVRAYVEHQALFDASVPHGWNYYWKSHYTGELSDQLITCLVDSAWSHESPLSYTIMFHMGGAIRRVAPEATAFEDRMATHAVNINAIWVQSDQAEAQITWARRLWTAMTPFARGVYVNFLGDEGEERVRAAYGSEKYARLAALKHKYDPGNILRSNQNIKPMAPAEMSGGL